ncbi:hypothetical protein ElyMa_004003200 [Elysia marginata]|uniref:Uncharacterized protein n=1 Tax=Elysia marginata TaxID=1093978 RepID=A0AAV4FZA9_9GAST|nr:hypothetical protein ElyMa_004003200 [Elysia marginata]
MMKARRLPAPPLRFRSPSGLFAAKEERRIRGLLAPAPDDRSPAKRTVTPGPSLFPLEAGISEKRDSVCLYARICVWKHEEKEEDRVNEWKKL